MSDGLGDGLGVFVDRGVGVEVLGGVLVADGLGSGERLGEAVGSAAVEDGSEVGVVVGAVRPASEVGHAMAVGVGSGSEGRPSK